MESHPHAMSRYAAVTDGLIEKCQKDYHAGRHLGKTSPSLSGDEIAVIVAESLEADQMIFQPRAKLIELAQAGSVSDWSLAVLAEMFFTFAEDVNHGSDIFAGSRADEYTQLAWTALEHALNSPTASPMLWYEEIYFEVAQRYRMQANPCAVEIMQRGLLHDLIHYDAKNAANFVRDVVETHLLLDELDTGLALLARLLHHTPNDIWTYNAMAITFDEFGLTRLGAAAANRGRELLKSQPNPEEGLDEQLADALKNLAQAERQNREAEVNPQILTQIEAALQLDFAAQSNQPLADFCFAAIPGLADLPRKTTKSAPLLPPSPRQAKPKRNDPCWCGSGKKYKQCHMPTDK